MAVDPQSPVAIVRIAPGEGEFLEALGDGVIFTRQGETFYHWEHKPDVLWKVVANLKARVVVSGNRKVMHLK